MGRHIFTRPYCVPRSFCSKQLSISGVAEWMQWTPKALSSVLIKVNSLAFIYMTSGLCFVFRVKTEYDQQRRNGLAPIVAEFARAQWRNDLFNGYGPWFILGLMPKPFHF